MSRPTHVVLQQALTAVSLGDGVDELARHLRIGGPTRRGRAALRRYLARHGRHDLWDWARANTRRDMKAGLTYSERVTLTTYAITLDGHPAHILDATTGRATIATSPDHYVIRSWPTVKRTIKNGGHFTTQDRDKDAP